VPNHYDAVVLGAGMAGLGAGLVLKRENMNFVVLEAQGRVGGRVHTVEIVGSAHPGKLKVDAGAQWLHGRDNELFKFADKFNLIRSELSEEAEGDYIRDDGEKIDEFFVKKVDFKIGQILEECEEFVKHKNDKNFKFPESLESYLNLKFQDFLDELNTEKDKTNARQLLDWHRKFQIIDNSCLKFDDISAKNWGNYSFNGESCQAHLNVSGGLNRVVDKLEDSLQDHIKLNKNVDLIYWKSEQYNEKPNLITIVCDDGKIYTTNNLICTFPIGVLKQQHLEMFSPSLPIEHRKVIENIGFGTINKIFLHFDEKWWDEEWKGLQMIWRDELSEVSFHGRFTGGSRQS
jgi:spermine oxidase